MCHPPGRFFWLHRTLWGMASDPALWGMGPNPALWGMGSDPARWGMGPGHAEAGAGLQSTRESETGALLLSRDLTLQLPDLGSLAQGGIQPQCQLQRVGRILHPADRSVDDGDMEAHVGIAASGLNDRLQ